MAQAELPPFIYWRDGRPRFIPGRRERKLGFAGEDLRHADTLSWFTFEAAVAWGKARYAEIIEARARGRRVAPPAKGKSVEDLLTDWLASDQVGGLSEHTRAGYRKQVNAVIYRPQSAAEREAGAPKQREEFAKAPARAIGAPELNGFFEYQKRARGHHMALASIAIISAALTWGRTSTTWRLGPNPRLAMSFHRPPGRIVIYTDAEIRALVATADARDRASIGDAILLGLFAGQRQGDRLLLEDAGLHDNRRRFRQRKTGAIVDIRETPQLRARLAAAKARVAALALKLRTRPTTIVVDESTGRAYNEHTYRHVFAEIRAAAIEGIIDEAATAAAAVRGQNEPVWLLPPCPSLAGKHDQDLRDTNVTWLARAGATLPEIASITGHSLRSIHQILSHYLAITPELADSAIAKLVAWMETERIVV